MDSKDKFILDSLEDKILDTVNSYVETVPRPFGAVVSGGFDSGLLAAITEPAYAVRLKFPYGILFDESRYADAISKHLELPINEIVITPQVFKDNFKDAVKAMGRVTTHFSLVPLYILMKELSEKFTKASDGKIHILSGEGPDEYLGGYARQIIFDNLRNLYRIPELRNYHAIINKTLGVVENPDMSLMFLYADIVGYDTDSVIKWVKNTPELSSYSFHGLIGKMDMTFGQIEVMEQQMAKHFDIQFHYPYINEELAEFCYRLPDDIKVRDNITKWGFKEISKKYLPLVMHDRSKMGGPVAPVNKIMGWDLSMFDKAKYIEEQQKILGIKDEK